MIGNLLRVKDLPTNGEDSSRARTRVHHTISPSQTQKSAPRDDARQKKRLLDRKEREREREREKQKKERSPAAGDDPHWPTLWRWMFCGSHAQIHASKFNTRRRPLLFRERPESCECQRFAFVFFVRRTSTTRPPLMVCPPRRGGGEQRFGTAFVCVMSSFFLRRKRREKTFFLVLFRETLNMGV